MVLVFIILSLTLSQSISCDELGYNENVALIKNALSRQEMNLTQNERILLKKTNILIIDCESGKIETESSDGIILSKIHISYRVIPDPITRYKLGHYLRNKMVSNSEKIYFPDYNNFIKTNADIICDIIYYLYHKYFYGVYMLFPIESDGLLFDDIIPNEIEHLRQRLANESSLFLYGSPVHHQKKI